MVDHNFLVVPQEGIRGLDLEVDIVLDCNQDLVEDKHWDTALVGILFGDIDVELVHLVFEAQVVA